MHPPSWSFVAWHAYHLHLPKTFGGCGTPLKGPLCEGAPL